MLSKILFFAIEKAFTLLSILLFFLSCSPHEHLGKSAKPNIIIIYTDDMGIGDLSCYNDGWVKTPNINQLAKNGIKFQQYYTASPVCSPSRAAITTGIFPTELGINTYLHSREGNLKHEQFDFLDTKYPSMARILKRVGYKTGHFGKWHLGGGRDVDDAPSLTSYGFDAYNTTYEGPDPDKLITGSDWIWSKEDSIERWDRSNYFVDKSLDFFANNKGKPCFVNLWPDDMHDPWIPDESYYDKKSDWTKKEPFIAVLEEYDRQIGRLIDGLKNQGLLENTLIIFTSDNGAYPTFEQIRTNGLRGGKNSLFEGGVRMPFIVHWPAMIKKSLVDDESILSSVDILPSLCKITGAKLPKGFDYSGEDASLALLGKGVHKRQKDLKWDFGRNKYFNKPKETYHQSQQLAIRRGNWKALVNADGSNLELYDILSDPFETKNIAKENEKLSLELQREVTDWFTKKKIVRKK